MKNVELLDTYLNDTARLLNEYDNILKKRNSIGFLDAQSIDSLFRIMHTIKASSYILELEELVLVAHSVENILDYIRKFGNSCMPHSTVIELMFKTEYYFRSKLKSVVNKTPDDDHSDFQKELSSLMKLIPAQNIKPFYDPNKLIPFKRMFELMDRTIQDMCSKLGKKARLETSGEELLARHEIIDNLTVPVLHLIRNAMDHGIETPEERMQNGKPEVGVISITVGMQEDVLFVTVANDGKKLDFERILDICEVKGILQKPREEYSNKEIANFILMKGFSTKGEVTEFSGRGVGFDIVKSSVHNMGGTIFINDSMSCGLSIIIAIPENKELYES